MSKPPNGMMDTVMRILEARTGKTKKSPAGYNRRTRYEESKLATLSSLW